MMYDLQYDIGSILSCVYAMKWHVVVPDEQGNYIDENDYERTGKKTTLKLQNHLQLH